MIIHVRTAHRRCQAQIVAQDTEQKHGKQDFFSCCLAQDATARGAQERKEDKHRRKKKKKRREKKAPEVWEKTSSFMVRRDIISSCLCILHSLFRCRGLWVFLSVRSFLFLGR